MKHKSSLISNERSEGSKLISELNMFLSKNDLGMKEAVGELSLKTVGASDNRSSTLFPDILIFQDQDRKLPLMGWELKMPDVSISDKEFISNARDKADRLGLRVFVLWNYKYVTIYIKDEADEWPNIPSKIFSDYKDLFISRKSVNENANLWIDQLKKVLLFLNSELLAEKFNAAPIQFNISTYIEVISEDLVPLIVRYYKDQKDLLFINYIKHWYRNEKAELETINPNSEEDAYRAFAKNIIIKWINRILFSHIIKEYHNGVNSLLIEFSKTNDFLQLAKSYNEEVKRTDFYTILSVSNYETKLPTVVIESLNEFNQFLSKTQIAAGNDKFISELLENIIETSKRELMGLYTTPDNLAKLLVRLTMDKAEGDFGDFTVGSGTIAKNILEYVSKYNSLDYAHNHVWASDRYNFPLQIANLALTTKESINKKNIVFRSDVFDLYTGKIVEIVNPSNGELEKLEIPKFNYLISNLPFISSNSREEKDKHKIYEYQAEYSLSKRSDLYQTILMKYTELIDEQNGRIGVITSNSWFKTQKDYDSFYKKLISLYDVDLIIISNKSRWFKNSEVITAILILNSRRNVEYKTTKFVTLNKNIDTCTPTEIDEIVQSILFNSKFDLLNQHQYSYNEVIEFINHGMSLEPLFDNIDWVLDIREKLICINELFSIVRGTKTGADKLFLTKEQMVDDEHSYPMLKSLKSINDYEISEVDYHYFYTNESISELKQKNSKSTISYINQISSTDQAIKIKERSPKNRFWYQGEQSPQVVDFITSINPDKRFFWSMFKTPTAINQRAIGLEIKDSSYKKVAHAFLNTSISLFLLMSSGFGRALGATDLTGQGVAQSYILDYSLLNKNSLKKIIKEWDNVKDKKIKDVFEQLNDPDWIKFNKIVYQELGLPEDTFEKSKKSIEKLLNRRLRKN